MLTKIQLRPALVMAHLTENKVTLFNTACLYDFVPPRETQAQSESISPLKLAHPAVPAVTAISLMMPMQTFNSPTRSHAASHTTSPFIANASTMPLSLKERPIMASTSLQETIRLAVTLGSPGYGQGLLGLADIRSATGSTSGLTSGMGVVNLIF